MKKYYPYISIAVGFGVMALYLYSTNLHNQYIKEEGDKIVAARNIKATNNYINELGADVEFDYWLGEAQDTLYRSFKNLGGELLLTELKTNDSWKMLKVESKVGETYKYSNTLEFQLIGKKAKLNKTGKIQVNLSLAE